MTDLTAQQSTASLLSGMPGITVDARTCEHGSYVVLECADDIHALAVYELVMMSDHHAELVHSTRSASGTPAIRRRVMAEAIPVPDPALQSA